ncbi:MAG: hypothetical protein GQ564_10640 [Bacteroidales bacterium]|nr:hypothetical protein [Bacteroidales bacterium]
MRTLKSFCVLTLFFFINFNIYAGGFQCIKYEIEFTLINGSTIKGYYPTGNYEKMFDFDDVSFLDMIKHFKTSINDSITIYKEIVLISYPEIEVFNKADCRFKLNTSYPENVVTLDIDDIISLRIIETSHCSICDGENYYWNGISPNVITELSEEEINLLIDKEPNNVYIFWYEELEYTNYYALSYDNDINKENLQNICESLKSEYNYHYYEKLKETLKEKNIILLRIFWGS